jgi:signal peptidase I
MQPWLTKLQFWKKTAPDTTATAKPKKSWLREWLDALVFAGTVALIVRTFFMEAFMIPTSSMERTLMVGDFIIVSKFHYGIRLPMAPVAIPFVHNRLPGTHTKSFIEAARLPYLRLPGFVDVKRNDIVVFNYPADDVRPNDTLLGPVFNPAMKENYVKRCVAVPGDVIELRNIQVYIDGKPGWNAPDQQHRYLVTTNGEGFNPKNLEKLGFRLPRRGSYERDPNANFDFDGGMRFDLTNELVKTFQSFSNVTKVERPSMPFGTPMGGIFPQDYRRYPWNLDNFGPLKIPAKGMTIKLDTANLPLYRRCIEAYEQHKVEVRDGKIYIDDALAIDYTFAMNYYLMMGDNRDNSLDSRFWGMVPEDHIVGKPVLVFFSKERGIRWERLFKLITGAPDTE